MQPHRQINHNDVFYSNVFNIVTLASSDDMLLDDGDHTENVGAIVILMQI